MGKVRKNDLSFFGRRGTADPHHKYRLRLAESTTSDSESCVEYSDRQNYVDKKDGIAY